MHSRIATFIFIAIVGVALWWAHSYQKPAVDVPLQASPTPFSPPEPLKPEPPKTVTYHAYTIQTDDPTKELAEQFGLEHVAIILRINRTNSGFIHTGATLTIPDDFEADLSPFPRYLDIAAGIPKLIVVSQRVQAVGLYESDTLIRWAPTSTGKQSTPTKNGLFSTNWKGKEVVSTFDDEWILKWNFNIVNFEGISLHQYEMPGVPASHSCVRLFESDARFIYDWADEWILTYDGNARLAHGTPVVIFGEYAYDKQPPWKDLPTDPTATAITTDELYTVIGEHLETINTRVAQRAARTSTSE